MTNEFRDEVKPVAEAIAAERGAQMVIIKSANVLLSAEEDVDISNVVVERMLIE